MTTNTGIIPPHASKAILTHYKEESEKSSKGTSASAAVEKADAFSKKLKAQKASVQAASTGNFGTLVEKTKPLIKESARDRLIHVTNQLLGKPQQG